jgi:glutamine synthetase adenylyltransferase
VNQPVQKLIEGLPDPAAARRFIEQFQEQNRTTYPRLAGNPGLLSDVLTLASYSPLIATTLLQNPDYISWLEKKRTESLIPSKDDLLESLARFSLTNSGLDLNIMLARFRRRELMRIYLRDIRRLATIAEITEEISNLADAILEHALQQAKRQLDNLYGIPLEMDERGRSKPAGFCIVSLGKLGSKELNYASDIDLLFIYSSDGTTSGQGERGTTSNLEYFTKLSQRIVKTVGQQAGEGAAYRVDLRLRPHGSLGPLAQSLSDTVRYYSGEARRWEMQVLIRSRSSAGDAGIYSSFFDQTKQRIFSADIQPEETLRNVRESKDRIDRERHSGRGFNVKLSRGGIREIEFLAQGLQIAYGGRDKWLWAPHTLISLSRLADRGYIAEHELTQTSAAYDFLRRLEHRLQMENGLQTHTVPDDSEARSLVAAKMSCTSIGEFDETLIVHTGNVDRVFRRIFGEAHPQSASEAIENDLPEIELPQATESDSSIEDLNRISPRYAVAIRAIPQLKDQAPIMGEVSYADSLLSAIDPKNDFRSNLSKLRSVWSEHFYRIVIDEISGNANVAESKMRQTRLAEASLEAAIDLAKHETSIRFNADSNPFLFSVLALGKLGGGSVDYDSDLDVLFVYGDGSINEKFSASEYYSRVAETVINALSSVTKDGTLYRIDVRLRPYGNKGQLAISQDALIEYFREKAEIWELLAFVKIRGVAGDRVLAKAAEQALRIAVHDRGFATAREDVRKETLRIRSLLEKQRARRKNEIDIKYGEGGMLDVYFAMRYLQLAHNVPDDEIDRSTGFMLGDLHGRGLLTDVQHESLASGYRFLSSLDHRLRLVIGRTTKLPAVGSTGLDEVAHQLEFENAAALVEELSFHRLNVRAAFNEILESVEM